MRLATDSDKRAVGLGAVHPASLAIASNQNRLGTTVSFANMYWPDYKVAIQYDAPSGYSQPEPPKKADFSDFLENPLDWAEENSTIIYWAVGGLAVFALIDSVM